MSQNSKIAWCHHTFNPWRGCTKVSDGCKNCYADKMSFRNPKTLGIWGPNGTRVVAAENYWRQPLRWNDWAVRGVCYSCGGTVNSAKPPCPVCDGTGTLFNPYRARVFCASLADVFEGPETMPEKDIYAIRAARVRLLGLINATPNLDWLLLTKRPEGVMERLREAEVDAAFMGGLGITMTVQAWMSGNPPANVWLGTSVEDQKNADERIPHLLRCPAAVRFLSCEPFLGPIDIERYFWMGGPSTAGPFRDAIGRRRGGGGIGGQMITSLQSRDIHWVIVGGESGHGARVFDLAWARSIVAQCAAAGVACFVKQLGARAVDSALKDVWCNGKHHYTRPAGHAMADCDLSRHLKDKKGGDITEFPTDLQIREFPGVAAPADAR